MKRFFAVMVFVLSCSLSTVAMAQAQSASPLSPDPPVSIVPDLEWTRVAATEARYHEQLRKKAERPYGTKMIIIGAVLLGSGYLASLSSGIAMMVDVDHQGAYFCIPIVGNPIVLGMMMSGADNADSEWLPLVAPFLVFMMMPTVAQLTGTILLSAGLIQRARYNKESRVTYAFAPAVTSENADISFSMTF
jgi:hypothetical protein